MSEQAALSGMTVNERLFEMGLFDQFERAAQAKDRAAFLNVLNQIELSSNNVCALLAKYGFDL